MKTNLLILAAASSLGLSAQMTAKVPFAFEINGRQMPAGKYDLKASADLPYATFRHSDTGRGFLVVVGPSSAVKLNRSVLTFLSQPDRYILTTITDKTTGNAMPLPRGKAARETAKGEVTSIAVTVAE